MKHMFRGITAVAVGLFLSTTGLAAPADAAVEDCEVSIADVTQAETNADADIDFIITATPTDTNGCDNIVVTYAFDEGTATAGTDFTAIDDEVTFGATGAVQTRSVTATIEGDTEFEPDETFFVTLDSATAVTFTEDTATGTITNDDPEPPGIATGGVLAITPTSGPPGTVITVSGTKCEATTVDVALGASAGESGGPVVEKTVTVNADDSFTTTLAVPTGSDPNLRYVVVADCGPDSYPFQAFDVTPSVTASSGYRMVAGDGGIFTFGDRVFRGSTGNIKLNKPIVGGATDTSDFDGYWIVASDGGVFAFNADFYGSLASQVLASPAVEIEPTPTGKGYWIVLANGKVHKFGDAELFGDFSGKPLNKPVIGMSVTPTGKGYWLVAEDGGIFSFGDAAFYGSMGGQRLNAPVIDLAPAPDNKGYFLVAKDGGVFAFGSAVFKGSTGSIRLNAPVVAVLVAPSGGYWLAASDGGIFTFGGLTFFGSMGSTRLNSPVLDLIN